MLGFKKLDFFVLKSFGLLFCGTFFICLFVFMMQYLWRWVDDLIGKGLSFDVLAQFFYYSGIILIPMSLPLAILLASLITFGNFGEKLELLAMKAAGIPLIKVFRPLIILCTILAGLSFYFQNVTVPNANMHLATLIYSIKQTSPQLEIPEGEFYNEIPGFNIYVKSKNKTTGSLYDVIIYRNASNYQESEIVLADSAKIEMVQNAPFLRLTLHNGERFRNMQGQQNTMGNAQMPYMRESFIKEVDMLPFDDSFNLLDASLLSNNAVSKNMTQLKQGIDSLTHYYDSIGRGFYYNYRAQLGGDRVFGSIKTNKTEEDVPQPQPNNATDIQTVDNGNGVQVFSAARHQEDVTPRNAQTTVEAQRLPNNETGKMGKTASKAKGEAQAVKEPVYNIDSVMQKLQAIERTDVMNSACNKITSLKMDCEYKALTISDGDSDIRRHWIQWYQKITLSFACIIFFFIGGSLGAIIRKGGLGVPVIISVAFFLFYYIIDFSGMKMARAGQWQVWFGMLISTIILVPISVFLTYKSNNDSVMFNWEAYQRMFMRVLGLRSSRTLAAKEFTITDPDYPLLVQQLNHITHTSEHYMQQHSLLKWPSYIRVYFRNEDDNVIEKLSDTLDDCVEQLANTRDSYLIGLLNELPIVSARAHTRPFHDVRLNSLVGLLLPVGVVFYIRIIRFRLRLFTDLRKIINTNQQIKDHLLRKGLISNEPSCPNPTEQEE